ncbi:MAG: hypothetical protein LAO79_03095 [Acidobacteriia bacterium]|nr:hypothetical protein [Terriglobia bacterium]
MSRRLQIVALICLTGIVFSWFAWPAAPLRAADTREYLEVARDLADGRIDQLHERTPGFPLLLLMTGSAAQLSRPLFAVLLTMHAAAVLMISECLTLSTAGAAGFAALLWLPPFSSAAAYAMTEIPAEFALAAAFFALWRYRRTRRMLWIAAAAAAIIAAAAIRPTYLLLSVPIALWAGMMHVRRSAALVLGLAPIAAMIAYCGFNLARFGYFGVSPKMGFSLSTRTLRVLERIPDSDATEREMLIRARDASLVRRGSSHTGVEFIWEGVLDQLAAEGHASRVDLSRYMMRVNERLIAAAPLDYLLECARSAAGYWFPHTSPAALFVSRRLQFMWAAIEVAMAVLFFFQLWVIGGGALLALLVGSTAPRVDWFFYGMAAVIVLYTMVVSCMVEVGDPRYRMPTDIFALFMIFSGANALRRSRRLKIVSSEPALSLSL